MTAFLGVIADILEHMYRRFGEVCLHLRSSIVKMEGAGLSEAFDLI
jgi:hypothetical protein